MKIAVCGGGNAVDKEVVARAKNLGLAIAQHNVLILTGAGTGYPYEVAKTAFNAGSTVVGISPAKDEAEHKAVPSFVTVVVKAFL